LSSVGEARERKKKRGPRKRVDVSGRMIPPSSRESSGMGGKGGERIYRGVMKRCRRYEGTILGLSSPFESIEIDLEEEGRWNL